MDISILLSLLIGFASLIIAFMLEGGNLGGLLVGTAAMIVFGGTIGAVGVSFPAKELKRIPGIFKTAFSKKESDLVAVIEYFKNLSANTRKNGLLSLEGEFLQNPNMEPFTKQGFQMVVDGVESSNIRNILELKLEGLSERHRDGAAIFEAAGGFAPTMGIIGTVMGLVHVLSNLDDPSSLGPKIAVAFIATLYGVSSANLLWLPIASKLKALNKIELNEKQMVIEGIILIQEGASPNSIVNKLKSFLDNEQLAKMESMEGK